MHDLATIVRLNAEAQAKFDGKTPAFRAFLKEWQEKLEDVLRRTARTDV